MHLKFDSQILNENNYDLHSYLKEIKFYPIQELIQFYDVKMAYNK